MSSQNCKIFLVITFCQIFLSLNFENISREEELKTWKNAVIQLIRRKWTVTPVHLCCHLLSSFQAPYYYQRTSITCAWSIPKTVGKERRSSLPRQTTEKIGSMHWIAKGCSHYLMCPMAFLSAFLAHWFIDCVWNVLHLPPIQRTISASQQTGGHQYMLLCAGLGVRKSLKKLLKAPMLCVAQAPYFVPASLWEAADGSRWLRGVEKDWHFHKEPFSSDYSWVLFLLQRKSKGLVASFNWQRPLCCSCGSGG